MHELPKQKQQLRISLDQLADLAAEQVVHDAGALHRQGGGTS